MPFSPIAIVGQGCVLPGALNPAEFWELLRSGRTAICPADPGSWRLDHARVRTSQFSSAERTVTDHGGYVSGFEARFDPCGFSIDSTDVRRLEPAIRWLLDCAREALASCSRSPIAARRQAVIIGNLGYPTAAQSRQAERVWLAANGIPVAEMADGSHSPAADANFAEVVARGLSMTGESFSIDAACASSIYAIDLACQALQRGDIDLALAGGSNNSDDLFLHIGFTTLRALSPTGYCRPFSRQADGLIPAHGAALVALKRLEDAIESGDSILGVIRGIGLSNDGRTGGFLSPSQSGQVRAIRAAYQSAGLSPDDVQFVECHATGTTVGDGVELAGLREVFGRSRGIRLGSHKGNIGHAITAAGAAGLLKLLGMFKHRAFVPSVPATEFRDDAMSGPFHVCSQHADWHSDRPRLAGLSAFGFGGANAHLIVEEPAAVRQSSPVKLTSTATAARTTASPEIVVISANALTGSSNSWSEFAESVSRSIAGDASKALRSINVSAQHLGFPPRDLAATLPQQVAMMAVVDGALTSVALPKNRTAVLIGTDVEHEICRYGARWRVPELAAEFVPQAADEWIQSAKRAFTGALEAAGVTGTMPNIAAHRINVKHDLQGPGYTVSASAQSGVRALQIAIAGLASHQFDAAIVGAVDLCSEAIHEAAARSTADSRQPGDAAVAFVLKRRDDAQNAGDPILGTIRIQPSTNGEVSPAMAEVTRRFGNCGAATGLLQVALTVATANSTRHVRTAEIACGDRQGICVSFEPVLELMEHHSATSSKEQTLTFPAHPPRVVFPAIDNSIQPRLASKPTVAARQNDPVLVSRLHSQYVQELTLSHQQFLAGRSNAIRTLMTRSRERYGAGDRAEPAYVRVSVPDYRRLESKLLPPAVESMPPTPPPESNPATGLRRPTGPSFTRSQLEVLAGGRVSEVFGPLFRQQDLYQRQVRLPMPPMLLADRVAGIDAEPGKLGTGTIWTETDVRWDSWYLHQGTMPAGIMIESGQADLLLISWMGADFLNRDERVYRLLGCEATFFGGLPRAGETLRYEITIDGHARQGEIRLFFFHYDCYVEDTLRLRVRHGQAGFFTDQELNETDGILWSPESRDLADCPQGSPAIPCEFRQFSQAQVADFYAGDLANCFGRGFEKLKTHSRTPRIAGDHLKLFHEISAFDPEGGPWGRGYLRAEQAIRPDDWFFDGHFLNDPCMPGTLMFEASLQAMSFYLTALGFTTDHDGWQFEPVSDASVTMQCRGQVLPTSERLTIEVLVEEVVASPEPTLFADLLCTVDGVKAFYARRVGLRLVPSWPITSQPMPVADGTGVHRANLRGDYAAFLECAWGRPSAAFGPDYAPFDRFKRTPRLPGPPYHFISRATRIDAEPDNVRPGASVEVQYDVPRDAWYFDKSLRPTMPLAVLMEVILQPCGWLAMMSGVVLKTRQELFFRNLDGKSTVYDEVIPTTGRLTTAVRLTRSSTVGDTTIMFFETSCHAGERLVAKLETSFGFFTRAALAEQVGVPSQSEERARIAPAANPMETWNDPVSVPMLRMSDRIREYSVAGGRHGHGQIHAEQDVDAAAWYFKAHFYQDPVQPGSLGVQALINLLTEWLSRTHGREFASPHFEPIACDEPMVWTYRGQVVPTATLVQQCVDIVEVRSESGGIVAVAEGTLWVDGLCIYRLPRFAVRVIESASGDDAGLSYERVIDPNVETWWMDHCPTHAVPAMPLMGIANELARAAGRFFPNATVVGIRDLSLSRWLTLASPVSLRFTGEVVDHSADSRTQSVRIQVFTGDDTSRPVAVGTVLLAESCEEGCERIVTTDGLSQLHNPYDDASLFHGPAFQLGKSFWSSVGRSVVEIDLDGCVIPADLIHPGLLDAALHGVPHADWSAWIPDIEIGQVGYPIQLQRIDVFGPPPMRGRVMVEARLIGANATAKTQTVEIQIVASDRVWASIRFIEKLFPMGRFAKCPRRELRGFIRDRDFQRGISLSQKEGTTTRLTAADIASVNWLPGTVEHIYGISGSVDELLVQIAVLEHIAEEWKVHPSCVEWNSARSTVYLASNRSQSQRVIVSQQGPTVTVRSLT